MPVASAMEKISRRTLVATGIRLIQLHPQLPHDFGDGEIAFAKQLLDPSVTQPPGYRPSSDWHLVRVFDCRCLFKHDSELNSPV